MCTCPSSRSPAFRGSPTPSTRARSSWRKYNSSSCVLSSTKRPRIHRSKASARVLTCMSATSLPGSCDSQRVVLGIAGVKRHSYHVAACVKFCACLFERGRHVVELRAERNAQRAARRPRGKARLPCRGQVVLERLHQAPIVRADLIDAQRLNVPQTGGGDDERRHRRRPTPETHRVAGVPEGVNVHLERIFVREPA